MLTRDLSTNGTANYLVLTRDLGQLATRNPPYRDGSTPKGKDMTRGLKGRKEESALTLHSPPTSLSDHRCQSKTETCEGTRMCTRDSEK